MALRVFEARIDRVQVGNSGTASFDTELKYVYKSPGSTIKYTNDPTIRLSGANLTYRFDGLVYTINSAISFSVAVQTLSAD
jgi:hypothetical protein